MLSLRSLLQEAGRRNVAKVAVLYAAVAFGFLEAADIIIPALGLPDWTIRWAVALSLLGFPVALILAWIYDFTPGGVVRTGSPEEEDGEGDGAPRKPDRPFVSAALLLFSASLVILAAFFAYEWSVSSGPTSGGQAGGALNPLRVAVLPFADLDGTDESGFLANGIHDDILNDLAKIDALEVVSRTSVLQYRNTEKSLQTIGRELGAGTVLEGSVRRLGDRIRVVAQLIDARTDNHLWSEEYDREEADIFKVQSEIAQEIARALKLRLTSAEVEELEEAPVVTGPAYNKYAEGITHWDLRENRLNAFRSAQLFQEAVDLDPTFARGFAALSQARMWLFWNFPGFQDQAELAREALDHAIELAPNAVETLLAQGYFYFYGQGDPQEAIGYFRRAESLKPSDSDVISAIGLILRGQGNWAEAVESLERARGLDLKSYNLNYILGETYFRMRRYEDARSAFQLAANMAPEVLSIHRELLRVHLAETADTVAAREYVEGLPRKLNSAIRTVLNADLAYYRGDFQGSLLGLRSSRRRGEEPDGAPSSAPESPPPDSIEGVGQRVLNRPYERIAITYYLLGNEELQRAYADSLRLVSEAVLEAAGANPGPDQTVVKARATAKLGVAFALLGEDQKAFNAGFSAVFSVPVTTDAYEGADYLRDLIVTLALTGNLEMALEPLQTALNEPSALTVADLRLDPVFEPLRQHPVVQEMLAQLQ